MLIKGFIGLDKGRLRRYLMLFFIALALPTAILIQQSYSRLKWEAFHQHQVIAAELSSRIDKKLSQLIDIEQQRPFTAYSFLNVIGDKDANYFQRSALSDYPIESSIDGVVGYFQLDSSGRLSSPLLPINLDEAYQYGVSEQQLNQRIALQQQIHTILAANNLVSNDIALPAVQHSDARPAILNNDSIEQVQIITESESYSAPSAFDDLKMQSAERGMQNNELGRLEDLKIEQHYQLEQKLQQGQQQTRSQEKTMRKEINTLPAILAPLLNEVIRDELDSSDELNDVTLNRLLAVRSFESTVDGFEFGQLASGHFVLYRKVWLEQQRYIQGLLIEPQAFVQQLINKPFADTALSQMSRLLLVHQGNILYAFSGLTAAGYSVSSQELTGELLYQTRLSGPLSELKLLFSINHLPAGSGGRIVLWLALILSLILVLGFYLMYRLGIKHINLSHQQQDFIASVSHELKTPLTSIRMYGDILRQGWASEDKKNNYYDFIVDESERLSRLINNVLLMAKLSRNSHYVELKNISITELFDTVKSKTANQVEQAGFVINTVFEKKLALQTIAIDADLFSQIMINLIDNAIKFSPQADKKIIELQCLLLSQNEIEFSVRDYGQGIETNQLKKIFQLFYRVENELTRETVGTGIGLSLVKQMTLSMKGKISVEKQYPGTAFRLRFPFNSVDL